MSTRNLIRSYERSTGDLGIDSHEIDREQHNMGRPPEEEIEILHRKLRQEKELHSSTAGDLILANKRLKAAFQAQRKPGEAWSKWDYERWLEGLDGTQTVLALMPAEKTHENTIDSNAGSS